MTQTEIRQVLDVTKIEQWQPLVTKIKFPFLVSKIPPIPFCTVDRRSRNKFRRGVKSTKFAIAGAKRKKRNFIEICHTQVEITASKFSMAAIRNSGQPQSVRVSNLLLVSFPLVLFPCCVSIMMFSVYPSTLTVLVAYM